MATSVNQISAYIYGQDMNDWGNDGGIEMGFPAQQIVLIPLQPTLTMSTATMNAKIKVIGTSNSYSKSPEFYTDKTVANLITAANT